MAARTLQWSSSRTVRVHTNVTTRNGPAIVLATRSGGTTIDQDAFGGNPFATALLQLVGGKPISFQQFPGRLRALTVQASQGHQVPEWTNWPKGVRWSFQRRPGTREERRCALVLIVTDYSLAGGAPLLGAAHDQTRISAMLCASGFSVVQGVAPTRAALLGALAAFARQAPRHDVAMVYSTGHGVEWNGRIYLLPGDYPLLGGYSGAQLRSAAVSVDRIAAACRATNLNFVFFAGCRTHVSKGAA
jgi:hypothetical protein